MNLSKKVTDYHAEDEVLADPEMDRMDRKGAEIDGGVGVGVVIDKEEEEEDDGGYEIRQDRTMRRRRKNPKKLGRPLRQGRVRSS